MLLDVVIGASTYRRPVRRPLFAIPKRASFFIRTRTIPADLAQILEAG